ncbi:MAG: transketolase [Candidatus Uhrbacteria bacterium]
METTENLEAMAKQLCRHAFRMTTTAGSGHPTSCSSCADILATLFFHTMHIDPDIPNHPNGDRFVLSKGHAAPILYAALFEAGIITDDLDSLRHMGSRLEGHPVPSIPMVAAATGSLGQGLAIGCGIALAQRLRGSTGRTYVLLGDGECAEGMVWEAVEFAARKGLTNLCAIIDVNMFGQSGPAIHQGDVKAIARRFMAFGWKAVVVDGHNITELRGALAGTPTKNKPTVMVAKTIKGHGVSRTAGKHEWHGKPLSLNELTEALAELAGPTVKLVPTPIDTIAPSEPSHADTNYTLPCFKLGTNVSTREAYGIALRTLGALDHRIIAVDGDVGNSTYLNLFMREFPDRSIQCYIAEQVMAGIAVGLAREGYIPTLASFGAFLTRAHDVFRMAGYSRPLHLIICGSHSGVSIGEDGPSQMALEDVAMMRSIPDAVVLCPADATATAALLFGAARYNKITYLRTGRPKVPVIYDAQTHFTIPGFHILRDPPGRCPTIIGSGITVHEALRAATMLPNPVRVVDCYCLQPLNHMALCELADRSTAFITAEDHYLAGGLGEAIAAVVAGRVPMEILAVYNTPTSGPSETLRSHMRIDAEAIVYTVRHLTR